MSTLFGIKRPTQLSNNPVLFISDKRDKSFHVRQRSLGDCWFLAGLLNLKYHENLFNFIVPSNDQSFEKDKYAGMFHFRFWQVGKWVDIVIDDRLYTLSKFLWYTALKDSNEFWVPLIEKAYAKLNYRSYKNIDGGFASRAMQDLSGCISEVYLVERKHETLFEMIYNAKIRKTMMTCGSYNEKTMKKKKKKNSLKIVLGHYYAITAVKIIKKKKKTVDHEFKLIRINNPHGDKASICYSDEIKKIYTESNKFDQVTMESELPIQVDGESWILYEDFIYYFDTIEICNLIPNSIIDDIYTKSGTKKLSLSAKEGVFMGGTLSKVVTTDDLLTIKPQYRIVLTEPDEGQENNNICSILISLSLKYQPDIENFIDPKLAIVILTYDETEENKLQKPLYKFVHEVRLINSINSMSGVTSRRLDLKLGTYYILPSIGNTFKGATFHLQIMSEQENILKVYDRNINMPSLAEKIHNLKSEFIEDKDSELFFKMARNTNSNENEIENRIDFKGLYNIFKNNEFSLNKNCHTENKLDGEIIDKLKLLIETNKFMPKKNMSIERITKILLELEEEYENFPKEGYGNAWTSTLFMKHLFKKNGYFIEPKEFKVIYHIFNEKIKPINLNNFILIIMTLKSHLGSYCEKFNVKLIQDLISLVLSGDEYKIDIQGFKKIIQFIKPLKENFIEYASTSYRTVPFTKFKKLLDSIDYKLTYNMIVTIYQTYGNGDDIFYQEFVQSVIDITKIFAKVPQLQVNKDDETSRDRKDKLFCDCWNKKQVNKN
ncbi:hypothetical protein HCN44_002272 [Aphidius gifuensis]|uniref:Calpain catalytic domain-containing protein n=1 Tax=Aphidius gifuensis TaxID=684658 RepID=A0A834Y0Y9_APHGI|nr:hypothetical protein HCN44_002272 [Aphidius gifuensis]